MDDKLSAADAEGLPDDALFFLADQPGTVNELVMKLYEQPNKTTIDHFKSVNEHLTGGDVKAGQMIIVTPPNPQSCTKAEAAMQIAAESVDKQLAAMSEQERRKMSQRYAFLSDYTNYTSVMYGASGNYYGVKIKRVQSVLKNIDALYKSSHSSTGKRINPHFLEQRRSYFLQLDYLMNGLVEKQMFGPNVESVNIKRKLGLSTKSLVHQWKQQGGKGSLADFEKQFSRTANVATRLKRIGHLGIALDIGVSALEIHKACRSDSKDPVCKRTAVVESSRAAGSIVGGMAAATAAYWGCSLVFAGPSAGTSLLWCGIIVGGAAGYGGSQAGSIGAKFGASSIYDKVVQ